MCVAEFPADAGPPVPPPVPSIVERSSGGYIDFDDYHWTIDGSPTVNPRVYPRMREMYTEEQMQTSQVALIVELLVRRPGRYEEVVPDKITSPGCVAPKSGA